ncbi:MAG: AIM24 family protein [Myxococcota bacterium]
MSQNESVLDALVALEHEQLARYCDSISVDGVIAQTVTLSLGRGQHLWCSRGSLLAYSEGVDWTLKIPGGAGKAVGRMLAGEGVSLTYVTANRPGAQIVLSANQPGRLVTWDLSRGPIVCTSGSFVAALGNVDIDVTVARSAGAALFGGAGLFMQRLSGEGIVIVHGAGDFIEHQLGAGENLLVSTGNLAVFSADVHYSIRRTGGCMKSFFGGEGLFMTQMTGPGWVMLQSLKKLPVPQQGQM